jgi:large subunit ribosomal protein L4
LLARALGQLGLTSNILIVVGEKGTDLDRAARNLPDVKLVTPEQLNVYDLLRYRAVVIPERVVARLQEVWS